MTRNLLDLSVGSPTMTTITNLQNQGAWVNYNPQNQPPSFYSLRTNWVIRPSTAADLQFSVVDDVTLADKVAVTVVCTSDGPLSNSAVALVRTSFYISSYPTSPIILPPIGIQPPVTGPRPLDAIPGMPGPIVPYGGGVSYWDLSVTPTLNQTGTMTLTLTATDDTGLSTNATMLVTVAPPQGLDGAWLGATNLVWQTGGNAPWFGQTNVSHNGSAAAQSGPVGVNEESWLETTVTGPGILTFWWGVGSASYGSTVSFTTSRGGGLYLQGDQGWRMERVSLPAGECVLDWSYREWWGASPSNACWLDQVSFVPANPNFWVELAAGPGPAGAGIMIHGEPGGLYELQASTNLAQWSLLDRVVLDLGSGAFAVWMTDSAASGSPRFYRARQLPADTMWFGPLTFDASGAVVLRVFSQPGSPCEILASTNLQDWSALTTLTNNTGTLIFTNAQPGPYRQFYKARQVP